MLNKILSGAKEIAIGGHVRPDGDCVGSCMGLRQYIIENYPDKKVTVYLEEIPDSFQFLKGIEEIRSEIPENIVYDLFQQCSVHLPAMLTRSFLGILLQSPDSP